MNEGQLDAVFHALADRTRRGMLGQLSKGAKNITELALPYDISQPAVSKHVAVLEKAHLVKKSRHGREFIISANAAPAEEALHWIGYYIQFWKDQFSAVENYLHDRKRAHE